MRIVARQVVERISRRRLILGCAVTALVLVVKTVLFVQSLRDLKVSSINDLLSSPQAFGMVVIYALGVIIIPLIILTTTDFATRLRKLYNTYAVKSLRFEALSIVNRYANLMPILLILSALFIVICIVLRVYQIALFSLIPFGIYILSMVKPVYDAHSHSKSIDSELKWFLVLLLIVEGVKANIKFLIDRLRYAPILSAISKELLVVDRDARIYGLSYTSALLARASVTPNNKLASIFSGYASRLRSGGETVSWLRVKLLEELMHDEASLRVYIERTTSILCQLMLIIYTVLPLIAITVFTINAYFVVFIAIVSTPLLIVFAYATQPKQLNTVPLTSLTVLPILCVVALSLSFYRLIGVNSVAVGIFVASMVTFRCRRVLKEVEILDRDSVEILRAMVELRQRGFDVIRALEYIAASGAIHSITVEKLKLALRMLEQGIPLVHVSVKVRSHSFLFRFTLFALGLIYECGSGDPETFQMLYEYVAKMRALRANLEKSAKLFDAFALGNIVLAVWIWKSLLPLYESAQLLLALPTSFVNTMDVVRLLVYTSTLGYALTSNTISRGVPTLGLKALIFLVVGVISTTLV